jgi:hypothetical protein
MLSTEIPTNLKLFELDNGDFIDPWAIVAIRVEDRSPKLHEMREVPPRVIVRYKVSSSFDDQSIVFFETIEDAKRGAKRLNQNLLALKRELTKSNDNAPYLTADEK